MTEPECPSPEARALARRHDGVTPERQRLFITALAATGSVSEAARQAGASRQAFYAHRVRDGGEDFLRAWDHALALSTQRLCDVAYERAIEGVEEPVFYQGVQIGTRRRYNDRLLMYLLRVRARDGFAPLNDSKDWTILSVTPKPSFEAMLAGLGDPEEADEAAQAGRRRRAPARPVSPALPAAPATSASPGPSAATATPVALTPPAAVTPPAPGTSGDPV